MDQGPGGAPPKLVSGAGRSEKSPQFEPVCYRLTSGKVCRGDHGWSRSKHCRRDFDKQGMIVWAKLH